MTLRCTSSVCLRALLVVLLLLVGFSRNQASAQQRPLPDSLARDSLRKLMSDSARGALQDSIEVRPDSLIPPHVLAPLAVGAVASTALAVWDWSADDLMREGALTLADLLQRIPGAVPFRGGLYLQSEVVSALGQTRGRLEIRLDGYVLDALTESSQDLGRIELSPYRRVRVERRLDLTRIDLFSLEATDARPQSRVEAGVGEPDMNLFRGMFLSPRFIIGPFGVAIERIDTDGYQRRQSADVLSGWLKWGWVRERGGIQAELRQTGLLRAPGGPWPGESSRRDLILRGRMQLKPGLVGEVFVGHSTFENDTVTVPPGAEEPVPSVPEASVLQFGGRTSFESRALWAEAGARVRNRWWLPMLEVDGQVGIRPTPTTALIGAFTWADWRRAGNAVSYDLRAQAGPWAGMAAFAEVAGGRRGAPTVHPTPRLRATFTERRAMRAGVDVNRWGISASAAVVRLNDDSIPTFGLPFDPTDQRFPAGPVTGVEATWSVPLLFRPLTWQGHFTRYREESLPLYLPRVSWLTGLQLHTTPLRSGNLEILGRLELRHRGPTLAPGYDAASEAWQNVLLPEYTVLGAYLQIRVMDVRLFFRADNIRNVLVEEFPGVTMQTPSLMYGVKWNFWN